MYRRHLVSNVIEALGDTPVVAVVGARQVGKSTLVKALGEGEYPARYVTLDDPAVFAAAQSDPVGFISSRPEPLIVDEVQRVPDLFRPLKAEVDRARRPGRFILTGSADVMLVPHLGEALVGRMELLTLWPLSQGELRGVREAFVGCAFADNPPEPPPIDLTRDELIDAILAGGYPEAVDRASQGRRKRWFRSYVALLLNRDVRELAHIEHLKEMPRLLDLAAARITSLLNYSEMAQSLAIPQSTLKRYLALLEKAFIVRLVPPWSSNRSKRLVKSPRVHLVDTGLACSLLGMTREAIEDDPKTLGPLLENFVAMELTKQAGWSRTAPLVYHYRTYAGREVDVVIEAPDGSVGGVEVKASASLGKRDFAGLDSLAEDSGPRFHRGIVLYTGREPLRFGPGMWAWPVGALWGYGG